MRKIIHKIQDNFHCCSFNSMDEFLDVLNRDDPKLPFPRSCCKGYKQKSHYYNRKCFDKIKKYISEL